MREIDYNCYECFGEQRAGVWGIHYVVYNSCSDQPPIPKSCTEKEEGLKKIDLLNGTCFVCSKINDQNLTWNQVQCSSLTPTSAAQPTQPPAPTSPTGLSTDIISPRDGDVITTHNPHFKWQGVVGETEYELFVYTATKTTINYIIDTKYDAVNICSSSALCEVDPGSFLSDGEYGVSIYRKNNGAISSVGGSTHFTVKTAAAQPTQPPASAVPNCLLSSTELRGDAVICQTSGKKAGCIYQECKDDPLKRIVILKGEDL